MSPGRLPFALVLLGTSPRVRKLKTWAAFFLLGSPIKRLDKWAEDYIVDRVSGRADW